MDRPFRQQLSRLSASFLLPHCGNSEQNELEMEIVHGYSLGPTL